MTRPLFRQHRLDQTFRQAIRLFIPTIIFFIVSFNVVSQIVNIPDANFKAALVNNTAINTNSDSEIQVSEATAFSDSLELNNYNISDLTGIEAFTAITYLNCRSNLLTNLNVSANTNLIQLICSYNYLTSLDVSANTALTKLECSDNELTNLDVSAIPTLDRLICSSNQLTSLDVSTNTGLTFLHCSTNQLTSLNISSCTALDRLFIDMNPLTSLDVSNNTALTYLTCYQNQLTSLDVSTNTALDFLRCPLNQLTTLDISSNIALTQLHCWNNQLISLNLQNGNNANLSIIFANTNPNLSCINVDDADWSESNWGGGSYLFDSIASFSEDCSTGEIEYYNNSSLSIYPNPTSTAMTIETTLVNSSSIQTDIKNSLGQIVYTLNEKAISGLYKKTIDLNLVQGIYFLTLQTNQGLMTKRIEIVK